MEWMTTSFEGIYGSLITLGIESLIQLDLSIAHFQSLSLPMSVLFNRDLHSTSTSRCLKVVGTPVMLR